MAPGKVSPRALRMAAEADRRGEQIPVIVKFHSGHSKTEFHSHTAPLTVQSTRKDYSLIPAIAMWLRATEIESLAGMEEVAEVWYDEPVYTMLNSSVAAINVPRVWSELGIEGEGTTICVLDTGLDTSHPDFEGRIQLTADFTGLGSVTDLHGHGTHIASIVTGSGVASGGMYRGIAPKAMLMAAKVLDGHGNGRMSDVMAGIEWATANGAGILVLSLGTEGSSDGTDALCTMVNAVVEMGKVVVVAAGNDGPAPYSIGSPGAADRAITVGATIDDGAIAEFSGRGPTADGRTKPEVVAPGSDVIAARAAGTTLGAPIDEAYTSVTGSSMAVPHVAGVCALMWSANPSLLPDDIKWILMDTAVDLGLSATAQGVGRVDALAAVRAARSVPTTPTASGESWGAPSSVESGDISTSSAPLPVSETTTAKPAQTTLGCLGSLLSMLGFH